MMMSPLFLIRSSEPTCSEIFVGIRCHSEKLLLETSTALSVIHSQLFDEENRRKMEKNHLRGFLLGEGSS